MCPLLGAFQDMVRRCVSSPTWLADLVASRSRRSSLLVLCSLEGGDTAASSKPAKIEPAAPLPGAAFASLTAAAAAATASVSSSSSATASAFADGAQLDADMLFGHADSGEADRAEAAERRMRQTLGQQADDNDDEGFGGHQEQPDFDVDFDAGDASQEGAVRLVCRAYFRSTFHATFLISG